MQRIGIWARARTTNTKTGDIPALYIGESIAQARASCRGCPLLPEKGSRSQPVKCYAWSGTVRLAIGAVFLKATRGRSHRGMTGSRTLRNGGEHTVDGALAGRVSTARHFRFGAIGDPARADRRALWTAVRKIRRAGLKILAYTHHWREYRNRGLKTVCLASCDSLPDADQAAKAGWIPATILPRDSKPTTTNVHRTPGGRRLLACPNQTQSQRGDSEPIQCDRCGLCNPEHPVWSKGTVQGIGFYDH